MFLNAATSHRITKRSVPVNRRDRNVWKLLPTLMLLLSSFQDLAWFQGPSGGRELAAVLRAVPPFVEGATVGMLRRVAQYSPAPQRSPACGVSTEHSKWLKLLSCRFGVDSELYLKPLQTVVARIALEWHRYTRPCSSSLFWKWWHTQLIDNPMIHFVPKTLSDPECHACLHCCGHFFLSVL